MTVNISKTLLFILTTTSVCFVGQSDSVAKKDSTMERGAIGCEVAEATILRIETALIFKDFHFTLNRLAMAFGYGINKDYIDDVHVGMWAISHFLWERQRNIVYKNWTESYRKHLLDQIYIHFCIDWNEATFEDVEIPMYSALTIAILIHDLIFRINVLWPIQSEMEDQAKLLFNHIYLDLDVNLAAEFIRVYTHAALEHDKKPVEQKCMKCKEQGTDIVFVIDASEKVTDKNWKLQQQFVHKFMKEYNIGKKDNEFQVGFVFYGSIITYVTFKETLDAYKNGDNAVKLGYRRSERDKHKKSDERMTHIAIERAAYMLSDSDGDDYGGRTNNPKIRKSMVVLASANCTKFSKLKDKIKRFNEMVPNPMKIAIGTTEHAGLEELEFIVGKDGYAAKYDSFEALEKDYVAILRISCTYVPIMSSYQSYLKLQNFTSHVNHRQKRSYPELKRSVTLNGLIPGESRMLAIPYGPGDVINIKMNAKRNAIRALYSFNGIPPNTKRYDHAEVIMPGKRSDTTLEPFKIQDYEKCELPPAQEPEEEKGTDKPTTICKPGKSCIIMNIFPCGCPPQQTVYHPKAEASKKVSRRGGSRNGRRMGEPGKRGAKKAKKTEGNGEKDSAISRVHSAVEECETKCRNARHFNPEDLTIHTTSKRASN